MMMLSNDYSSKNKFNLVLKLNLVPKSNIYSSRVLSTDQVVGFQYLLTCPIVIWISIFFTHDYFPVEMSNGFCIIATTLTIVGLIFLVSPKYDHIGRIIFALMLVMSIIISIGIIFFALKTTFYIQPLPVEYLGITGKNIWSRRVRYKIVNWFYSREYKKYSIPIAEKMTDELMGTRLQYFYLNLRWELFLSWARKKKPHFPSERVQEATFNASCFSDMLTWWIEDRIWSSKRDWYPTRKKKIPFFERLLKFLKRKN